MGFFNLKKKKKPTKESERYITVCPYCGSADVSSDMSIKSIGQGSLFNEKKCNDCGFSGEIFPEMTISEAKKVFPEKNKE